MFVSPRKACKPKARAIQNPEEVDLEIRRHLRKYYNKYISIYNLDFEDLVVAVYLKLLEGAKTLNSACQVCVRKECTHYSRYLQPNDPI